LFFSLVLALFASGASAAIYSWTLSSTGVGGFSTPFSACSSRSYTNGLKSVTPTQFNSNSFDCNSEFGPGSPGIFDTVIRSGDSCPPDYTYNAATGACDAPEADRCEPTIGVEVKHRHRAGEFTGAGVIGGRVDPPGSVCKDQCQYAFSFKPAVEAYRFENGDPSGAFLAYIYRGNGVSCAASEPELVPPGDTTPSSDQQSQCTNKVVHADGSQTFDCRLTEVSKEPGIVECSYGQVGGEPVCIAKTPKPKLNDKTTDTTVEEKTNPDGSKDNTTTTTTTTTNCSGVNACSTSTTTNVTNNKTNADGTPGDTSSSCTGKGCKGGGDGSGDPEEEEPEDESLVTGDSVCEAPPACKGDAIQCAILRQTHKSRCDQADFQDLSADKVDAAKTTLDSEFAGDDYSPLSAGDSGTFDMAGMIDTSSSITGSCPALPDIVFSIGGHSGSFSFTQWMAELCKYAVWFSYLLVAFAMRGAAEIVAKGLT
jgi:hypothetical protein